MNLGLDRKVLVIISILLIASGFIAWNHFQDFEVVRPNPDYCELLDVNIDRSEENISVRNVGNVNIANLSVEWTNSSGKFSEEIESLEPAESKKVETGQLKEASVRTSRCDRILAEYP